MVIYNPRAAPRSLTDPPRYDDEVIHMNVTVRGTVPGNSFDASPYVRLSHDGDTFNTSDAFKYRRTLRVDIQGPPHVCACALPMMVFLFGFGGLGF